MDFDNDPKGPWFEAEDIGCPCTDDGMESEWEWITEEECWVCTGCGMTQ